MRYLCLAKPRGEMPDVPNCKFGQFTHEGHVWGIIDNVVDINLFNGSPEELQAYIEEKGIK
jgi:GH25 family lysozyme M1 (1,4-beta-N-acetylmuramidase)